MRSSPPANQKHYRANHDTPVFAELHGLVVKTIGLVGPLEEALSPFRDRIQATFIYDRGVGSAAAAPRRGARNKARGQSAARRGGPGSEDDHDLKPR